MNISLFCNNITVLDIAYYDKTKGLVGASYKVNVEFVGQPDSEGILIDFSKAKKAVKNIIDDICDHRFVLPQGLAKHQDSKFSLELHYGSQDQALYYEGPSQALCEIPFKYVSKAHIASYLEMELGKHFGNKFDEVKIELEEDDLKGKPLLSYTHGLKYHDGNCQRLFHGHHNSVDIWVNGESRPDLENWLIRDCFKSNVHFCTFENIVNKDDLEPELIESQFGQTKTNKPIEVKYQSSQGEFKALLPSGLLFIIPTESTVENLSAHFARMLQNKLEGENKILVKAYEGIAKGAISYL
jgi:6-pyruvoyl-tetrahydropterin synthase